MRTSRDSAGVVSSVASLAIVGGMAVGVAAVTGWMLREPPGEQRVVAQPLVPCGAGWLLDEKIPARIMPGIGAQKFAGLTTASAEARRFFEQGLALVYGFNHDEARRSFREAAKLDPECAMAYWGIAHTLGTNYNQPGAKERNEAGAQAIALARSLAPRASEMERMLIEATALRFPTPAPDSPETQAAADKAYSDAMRILAAKFGPQDDVQTFYAESMMNLRPWDLWAKDGSPHPGTEEILATLERVLERNPNHLGAIHLYIHATEASPKPGRSIRYADRLGQLAPNAGHIVHMPSHAYVRTGRWSDALEVNRAAIRVDDAYIASTGVKGLYPSMYAPHNVHFLSWAAMLGGDMDTALSIGTELARRGSEEMFKVMPPASMVLAWPAMMDVRFGKWDAALAVPEPDSPWGYGRVMRHFARGIAQVGKGDVGAAAGELALMREEAKGVPADMLSFGQVNKAQDIFHIADLTLSGRIEAAKGNTDRAVSLLKQAVSAEDALTYMEPSDWHAPTRHTLGAVLLGAKRYEEAAGVFHENLAKTPENGWALYGLAEALRQTGDVKGAEEAMARFAKVWAKPSQAPEFGWY